MISRNMNRNTVLPLAAAALLLGATSFAGAQTTSPAPSAMSAKADGSLKETHSAWRSTQIDGATVYNQQGNSVGTVDSMLLDSSGKVSNVVLSVGGFVGLDSKYVEVPFSKLKFEPSKNNANNSEYSIVLPDVTKDSLKAMTAFNY